MSSEDEQLVDYFSRYYPDDGDELARYQTALLEARNKKIIGQSEPSESSKPQERGIVWNFEFKLRSYDIILGVIFGSYIIYKWLYL